MRGFLLVGLVALACCGAVADARRSKDMDAASPNATDKAQRSGKLFSLFNVVSFSNDPCQSTTTLSGTVNRNGTCLTSTECGDRGGTVAGNCAASFGVCCVFILNSGSATVSENCTYIQNTGFPAALTTTDTLTFTVNKCSPEVCDLRLDFETFTTVGPTLTTEADAAGSLGGACTDALTITTPANMQIPTICGSNSGDHIYVNLGNVASDTATLAFAFTGANTARMFDIKITQIECGSELTPPNTCLQYLTGTTGRIQTFNFDASAGTTHLNNQEYSVCIRQEDGFCCVQYQVCPNEAIQPFSLISMAAAMSKSLIDSLCTEDFITIDGATQACMQGTTGPIVSRFCGSALNTIPMLDTNVPICDCSQPFVVGINTDNTADIGVTNTNAAGLSRGACLEYTQIPCAS